MDVIRERGFGFTVLSGGSELETSLKASFETSYDIIIVGGGIVGLSLACMLAQRTSLSIAVLEVKAIPKELPKEISNEIQRPALLHSYHHRVSAITLASQKIFKSLDVWNELSQLRVSPFKQIIAWEGKNLNNAKKQAEISFNSSEVGEAVLGYIIENNLIQSVLQEKLNHYPLVKIISPIQLKTIIEHQDGIEFVSEAGFSLKTKLAIAADGSQSWLRKQAGITVENFDYQQNAIVTTVETILPHQQIARQVFLQTGPLAFLPLKEKYLSSIVWSLPADQAANLMQSNDMAFQQRLAQSFGYRLGEVMSINKRYMFPLSRQKTKNYIKPHLALVGDAAHTIHPLAGQGVNMGLLDAASLADVISDAIKQNRKYDSESVLRQYERWRKADNFALYSGVDVLKQLFASDKKPIQLLRSTGLQAINRMTGLKNILVRHAIGVRKNLPSFAK